MAFGTSARTSSTLLIALSHPRSPDGQRKSRSVTAGSALCVPAVNRRPLPDAAAAAYAADFLGAEAVPRIHKDPSESGLSAAQRPPQNQSCPNNASDASYGCRPMACIAASTAPADDTAWLRDSSSLASNADLLVVAGGPKRDATTRYAATNRVGGQDHPAR